MNCFNKYKHFIVYSLEYSLHSTSELVAIFLLPTLEPCLSNLVDDHVHYYCNQ